MRERSKNVPESLRFPIDDLKVKYGDHFNGTVVMMLAFADYCGFEEIELYGIDFSSDEEYARRNQFYWMMGFLSARGVKITISPGGYMSDTCTTYMYEDDGLSYIRHFKTKAAEQIAEDERNISALEIRKAYMRGVNDTCAKFERRY